MNQKQNIIEYLENAYSGAKAMDDVELMSRLARAIVAFSYNDFEKEVSWDDMVTEYFAF